MKKYIFSVLFFISCFFFSFFLESDNVFAIQVNSVDTDQFDERIITISLSGVNPRTELFIVYEVEMCEVGSQGCEEITLSDETKYIRKLTSVTPVEYPQPLDPEVATITYNIKSNSDGLKYFYIEANWGGAGKPLYSCILDYTLTTLNQRVVINPDGNGKPLHVYGDHVQYSPSRVLNIKIDLLEEELNNTYSGEAYIFEDGNSRYSYWLINDSQFSFGLESYGDGEKTISIFLVKKGVTIDESGNVLSQLTSQNETKAKKISKKIYLDTIGPEITIEGGQWIVVNPGDKYSPQVATCKDATFPEDDCYVTNDVDIVRIDYKSDKHQIVTYEATDRLGNTKTVTVRVKVLQGEDKSNLTLYLLIAGAVLVCTGAILGYILIKNNEKKKKISYI